MDRSTTEPTVEIEQLRARHSALDRRLQEIDRHLSLTSEEQIEWARLKKEKLATKDRIARLERAARGAASP